MNTEDLLRTELRVWADEVAPDSSRDLSAAGLADLRRRRLRHRAELLTAAAAVVAVLLGAQAGASHLFDGSDRSTAAPSSAPAVDLLALPARGPLADDPAALAALVALVALVPAAVRLLGRSVPARTAWRVGAGGVAALAVFWVLIGLPLVVSDRGFWLTAALGAAAAALWLAPGRPE